MKTHVCINERGWKGAISMLPYDGPKYMEEVTVVNMESAKSGLGYQLKEYPGTPFAVNQFVEIQPPLDITDLIEECKTETV